MSPYDTARLAEFSADKLLKIALRMEEEGSHFSSALGTLYIVADGGNKKLLLNAFGHVFLDYKED